MLIHSEFESGSNQKTSDADLTSRVQPPMNRQAVPAWCSAMFFSYESGTHAVEHRSLANRNADVTNLETVWLSDFSDPIWTFDGQIVTALFQGYRCVPDPEAAGWSHSSPSSGEGQGGPLGRANCHCP